MQRSLPLLLMLAVWLGGCGDASQSGTTAAGSKDAEKFLRWSMDKHAALTSFDVKCEWTMNAQGASMPASTRTIQYEKPNKFKVVSASPNGFIQTCVSDGKKLVEFSNEGRLGAQSYDGPSSIATASSMQMGHPMFCGTLLYKFFAGSGGFDDLVDEDGGKIEFGPDAKGPSGEPAKTVKFYAKDLYGNVEAIIDQESGLVYRVTYDSAGLVKMMKEQLGREGPPPSKTTEVYSGHKVNSSIDPSVFAAKAPDGVAVSEGGSGGSSDLAKQFVGKAAPDFEVAHLDGQKVRLSSLKGKVVLIDFWATWCGPCVEGLPVTAKLHRELQGKGLAVLAISDEDKKTVEQFLKSKNLTLPTALDPDGKVATAYKVDGIPTMVVIDAAGKVASYNVGLEPESEIRKNLKKAGLAID